MKTKKMFIVVIPVILILAVFVYRYRVSQSNSDPNIIRVSGNIEVTDSEVSFKIAGRVESRLVSEGETVKAGHAVARLDSRELGQEVALRRTEVQHAQATLAELLAGSRPQDIAQAEASVQQAQARLDELLAGSRPQEVAVAEAGVQWARAEVDRWKGEYERQSRLYKNDVISAREFEVAQTAYETAKAKLQETEEQLKLVKEGPRKEQIDQARAALTEAEERLALIKEGPRRETIDQARARLQQAREALALTDIRLSYALLSSPLTGIVLSENVEPGEFVAAGTPVVTVGDLENVWLRAYIDESDLGRVKVGQSVRVTTDTYPGKIYNGRVSFIASEAEFTPKNVQTQKERVKLVYRIKIDIANSNLELKPGMPSDAELSVGGSKERT
jgi:HlyD family secretion protein